MSYFQVESTVEKDQKYFTDHCQLIPHLHGMGHCFGTYMWKQYSTMGDSVLQAELASIQCIYFCYHCEFASPSEQFSTNLSVILFVLFVYMYKSIQWQS